MIRLDVNTDASIQLTARLERLHRSAFPSAVRNTLNDAAFEAKKLIPKKANENFTVRQKNLFSRFSKVEKAKGFDINSMVSKVGLDGTTQPKLIDGLAKQETGGTLKGRKLTPHNEARVSGSYGKKLKSKHQFKNIGKIGTRNKRIRNAKYFVIENGNKETVFENLGNNKIKPVYNKRKSKNTTLKKKPFIAPSAIEASRKMERFYFKNANYQFTRDLRR